MDKIKPDWNIHYVYPDDEDDLPLVDCHSHGLDKYDRELQLVLPLQADTAGLIINIVGCMIKEGRRLKDGETITDVLENEEPIRIKKIGEQFRLIFRDPEGRWPEDEGCLSPYCFQEEPFEL